VIFMWFFSAAAVLYGGALVLCERWRKPPRRCRRSDQVIEFRRRLR